MPYSRLSAPGKTARSSAPSWNLSRFKHLEAEQGLFLTFDELPPSVKNITMSLCEYPVFNMLRDLTERSRCNLNLKSLETVILLPQSSTPDGMPGLSRSNNSDEIYDDGHYRAEFIEACDEIEKPFKEYPLIFTFTVKCGMIIRREYSKASRYTWEATTAGL
ncbi:hypothetical protein BDV23DRAFT_188442 [Aspergillus alliaceus]|uniref:Uncharacterized protein n=1 Tax=Petromyces alliaceus TaxID=209559 RepID=A0A5N7BTU8_PETAA|nr:hypothetical protein BDV23DRAFT_188442 [Aspergillus alliaceus]